MGELTFRKLRIWNAAVGALQLLTGCAILGITSYDERSKLPWYTFFIASWGRDNEQERADFYRPVPKKVASFPISVWSGVFLLLSALDHIVVVLPGVNSFYNRCLCSNRNPFRWAEYAISASLMQVMIAQLCGVTDIHLLFAIGSLMASCMLAGWGMEVLNGERLPTYQYTSDPRQPPPPAPSSLTGKDGDLPFLVDGASPASPFGQAPAGGAAAAATGPRIDWGPFLHGCWPFVAAEAITACFFFQAVTNGDPPSFVWSLFFIELFLYACFAINMLLQFKQVKGWRGFAKAEFWYILLSLTSKQLLAWVNYGGTKRFED